MTDIAPSAVPIQQESVQFNQPVSEASAGAMGAAINFLLQSILPVGSVIDSMLTEDQFQSLIGLPSPSTWILADGRDVTGSEYQIITGFTTIPDLRGIFTRGKNNGRSDGNQDPNGEQPLGTFESDAFAAHSHTFPVHVGGSPGVSNNPLTAADTIPNQNNGVSTAGGNETRPKCSIVNKFIRIN